jgi:glucose uptake protein GlcU
MWLSGGASGTLWSIGNFFSIISVEHLGEGVGYSVVQASMLISGLWGICFFHEIVDVCTITKWFVSAGLTVSGIVLLSYEHHEG